MRNWYHLFLALAVWLCVPQCVAQDSLAANEKDQAVQTYVLGKADAEELAKRLNSALPSGVDTVIAVARLNALVIRATKDGHGLISKWIEKEDQRIAAATPTSWRKLNLKRLKADIVAAMLNPTSSALTGLPGLRRIAPPTTPSLFHPTIPPQPVDGVASLPLPLTIEFAKIKRPEGVESVLAFDPLNALIVRATEDGHKRMTKLIEELESLIKEDAK